MFCAVFVDQAAVLVYFRCPHYAKTDVSASQVCFLLLPGSKVAECYLYDELNRKWLPRVLREFQCCLH